MGFCGSLCSFISHKNPENENETLYFGGRTKDAWFKSCSFYILFYCFLASFWIACFNTMLANVNEYQGGPELQDLILSTEAMNVIMAPGFFVKTEKSTKRLDASAKPLLFGKRNEAGDLIRTGPDSGSIYKKAFTAEDYKTAFELNNDNVETHSWLMDRSEKIDTFLAKSNMGASFPEANLELKKWCNGEDKASGVDFDNRTRDFYGYHTYSPCIFIRLNRIRNRPLFWASNNGEDPTEKYSDVKNYCDTTAAEKSAMNTDKSRLMNPPQYGNAYAHAKQVRDKTDCKAEFIHVGCHLDDDSFKKNLLYNQLPAFVNPAGEDCSLNSDKERCCTDEQLENLPRDFKGKCGTRKEDYAAAEQTLQAFLAGEAQRAGEAATAGSGDQNDAVFEEDAESDDIAEPNFSFETRTFFQYALKVDAEAGTDAARANQFTWENKTLAVPGFVYHPFPNDLDALRYADPIVAIRANFNAFTTQIDADAFEEKFTKIQCDIYYRTDDDKADPNVDNNDQIRSGLQENKAYLKNTRIVQNMRYQPVNVENAFENV